MDEDVDSPGILPHGPPTPASSTASAAGSKASHLSAAGKEYSKAPSTGSVSSNCVHAPTYRVPTPTSDQPTHVPEGKKRSVIKQLFSGMRTQSSVLTLTSVDTDTPGLAPATDIRRPGLAPKSSVATLLQKTSRPQLNKLKRKVSQATVSTARHEPPLDAKSSLEVTDFHQTPYGQRYGNTRRAEMNQIRQFIEEALGEDGEDEDVILGFEVDVPDHLPNSPLCPLDPRHRSGGKAICPQHGRKKRIVLQRPSMSRRPTAARKASGKTAAKNNANFEPHIVYEGKVEGWVDAVSVLRSDSAETAVSVKKQRVEQSADGAWFS